MGPGIKHRHRRIAIVDLDIAEDKAGSNLSGRFEKGDGNVWVYKLARPIKLFDGQSITVSVSDKQGNKTEIQRTFGPDR